MLFSLYKNQSLKCFELIPMDIIQGVLGKAPDKLSSLDPFFIHKFNNVKGFRVSGNKSLFIPSKFDHRNFGILARNRRCSKYLIKSDFIEVDNPQYSKTIFDYYKDDIIKLPQSKFTLFEQGWGGDLSIKDITEEKIKLMYSQLLHTYSDSPSIHIKATRSKIMGFALAFGTIHELKNNYRWGLFKQYGIYSPFFEPVMIDETGNVKFIFSKLFDSLHTGHDFCFLEKRFLFFKSPVQSRPDIIKF